MSSFFLLLLIIFVLVISIQSIYGFLIGAPILFSPKKAVVEALSETGIKPGQKFYDLGSGTGRSMLIAGKKFGLDPYGFELSFPLVLISKINFWLNGMKDYQVSMKNFYRENLGDADIIFCFLTPKAMLRLKSKFEKELKVGTKIISYAFSIPGWKPEKIIWNGTPGKIFFYIIK